MNILNKINEELYMGSFMNCAFILEYGRIGKLSSGKCYRLSINYPFQKILLCYWTKDDDSKTAARENKKIWNSIDDIIEDAEYRINLIGTSVWIH